MKLLLDTHVLLWVLGSPWRLTQAVLQDIEDPLNEVLFSAASIWEIAIKAAQGRSDFANDPVLIAEEALRVGFTELPVYAGHTFALQGMTLLHRPMRYP